MKSLAKPGRKSSINFELFRNLVMENKTIFKNGMINLMHPFIEEGSAYLNVTVRTFYLKVKRFIESTVFACETDGSNLDREENKIQNSDDESEFVNEDADACSGEDEDDCSGDDEGNCSNYKLIINLTAEESIKLRPFKEKKRTEMPQNWSYHLNVVLYKSLKLACAFTYKKGYVVQQNLKTTGRCSECNTVINIRSDRNMERLTYYIEDGKLNVPHYKKNRIRRPIQTEIACEISNYTASTYYNRKAAEDMENGDSIPPYIPNKGKFIIHYIFKQNLLKEI